MDTIMELAMQLGKAIKADARVQRMDAASAKYKEDAELQQKVQEYNVQTMAMTAEYKKPEKDMELIHAIEMRINTLYDEISALPVMAEYHAAEEAVQALMQEVNAEITFHVTGERPSNCTHDCSTCSGCHS